MLPPPGLRVADEVNRREFFQHFGEALEGGVVAPVLKMEQNRHLKFAGDFVDELHLLGIAVQAEFLLANASGIAFQPLFQLILRALHIRHFVAKIDEAVRMLRSEPGGGFRPVHAGREAVGFAQVRRASRNLGS